MSIKKKDFALYRTELQERSWIAIFLSSISYPFPVIAAMTIISGELPLDKYLFIGYLIATVIGLLLCISAGFATHFLLIQKDKIRLYHYYDSNYAPSFSEVISLIQIFGFSGFCLAGFFWFFYFETEERRFGHLDAILLAMATASIAAIGLWNVQDKQNNKTHSEFKIPYAYNLLPKFTSLTGPVPHTVKILPPEGLPNSDKWCPETYHIPITKKPIRDSTLHVVWEDHVLIPSKLYPDRVYASAYYGHCFWAKSHTYTEPGRYVIKLYTVFNQFSDEKQTPDHEFEVIVTEPNFSRLK